MSRREFNSEDVCRQISDIELKMKKLQLQKETLELALERHSRNLTNPSQNGNQNSQQQ